MTRRSTSGLRLTSEGEGPQACPALTIVFPFISWTGLVTEDDDSPARPPVTSYLGLLWDDRLV